jgi:hypothetical protein
MQSHRQETQRGLLSQLVGDGWILQDGARVASLICDRCLADIIQRGQEDRQRELSAGQSDDVGGQVRPADGARSARMTSSATTKITNPASTGSAWRARFDRPSLTSPSVG